MENPILNAHSEHCMALPSNSRKVPRRREDASGTPSLCSRRELDAASRAQAESFVMLRPDIQWANPVMFVVEVGAFLTLAVREFRRRLGQSSSQVPITYFIALMSGCS